MVGRIVQVQIGKKGVSQNFLQSLKSQFERNKTIKVSVLKSARGDGAEGKAEVKRYMEQILEELGKNYTGKVIGFTICLKRWRKAREA